MPKKKGLLGTGLPLLLRKVFNLGPARVSVTGSGLGVSVGVPGARAGVDAQGRKYWEVDDCTPVSACDWDDGDVGFEQTKSEEYVFWVNEEYVNLDDLDKFPPYKGPVASRKPEPPVPDTMTRRVFGSAARLFA